MKFDIYTTKNLNGINIATDDTAKVTRFAAWHPHLEGTFDETDPALAAWISRESLPNAKATIAKYGHVRISGGNANGLLDAPLGFFPKESHERLNAYWAAEMRKVGSIGGQCSMFRVHFNDTVSHKLHRHDDHDEIIYVETGEIDQIIGGHMRRLKAGDSAIIPRSTPHRADPLVPNTVVIVVLFGGGNAYASSEME